MKDYRTTLFSLLVLISINFGCAGSEVYTFPVGITENPELNVIDSRVQELKTSKLLSLNISNCAYGISRIGDSQLSPDRIAYLNFKLASELPKQYKDFDIVIEQFDIFYNRQATLRGTVGAVNPGGLIGGALLENACKTNGAAGGAYSRLENPNGRNATITNLTLVFDRNSYTSRGLALQHGNAKTGQEIKDAIGRSIKESIDQAIADLVLQLP